MPSGAITTWTNCELEYLIKNAHLGMKQLAINLQKPENTVKDKAYILRISLKKGGKGSGRNLLPGAKRRPKPMPKKLHLVLDPFDPLLLHMYPNALGGGEVKRQKNLWSRRRQIILKLHDHACYYCGDPANTIDHIKPRHLGGTDHINNLVAACQDCNFGWTQQITWQSKYAQKRMQGV